MSAPVDVLAMKAFGLTERQFQMLRDVNRDGGFDFLDPADYWGCGNLGWSIRERVIGALQRKGYLDGDKVTEAGRAALARVQGAAA